MSDGHLSDRVIGMWLRRPLVGDIVLVAALAAASLPRGQAVLLNEKTAVLFGDRWADAVGAWWITSAVALGALLLRRRAPITVCLVTTAVALYHMSQGWGALPADAAAPVALFSVVVHHRRMVSTAVVAGVLIVAFGWAGYVNDMNDPSSARTPVFAGSKFITSGVQSPYGKMPVPGYKMPVPVSGTPADASAQTVRKVRPVGFGGPWGSPLPPTGWGGFSVLALVIALAWFAGHSSRHRRAYLDGLLQRARDLERDRARQADRAVAAERSRISRELHDVVAHGLSVMVVQAQGGAAELDARPAHTRQALDAIVATGREALTEMRRLVDVLRDPRHPAGPDLAREAAQWEPQPGVAALPGLVARLRRTGLRVDLDIGHLPAVPPGVDVSAYRIVQEALTNVVKHAGPDVTAKVRLWHAEDVLSIEVTDDGRTGPAGGQAAASLPAGRHPTARHPAARYPAGRHPTAGNTRLVEAAGAYRGGHGLRGMRERAELLGGEFAAGPATDRGFRVCVRIPLPGGR